MICGEVEGENRPGATSLVPMDQTVDEIPEAGPWVLCPRIDHERQFWVNVITGERRPDSCRANKCPVCIVANARKKARVLSWADPRRYAVLTQAPTDWDRLRQKMRDLRRLLIARGYSWEQAWTVEPNPRETGLHVNVLQNGTYVPQDELQAVWGAIVYVKAIRRGSAADVASYGLKEARTVSGYSLKNAQGSTPSDHLRVNGGRLAHVSRGYFPLHPEKGKPYTQHEVWNELRREGEPGWHLVTS